MIEKEIKEYQIQYSVNWTAKDLLNKLIKLGENEKNNSKQVVFEIPDLNNLTDWENAKRTFYMFSLFSEMEKEIETELKEEKGIHNINTDSPKKITIAKFRLTTGIPYPPITIKEIINLLKPTNDSSIVIAEFYNKKTKEIEQFIIQEILIKNRGDITLRFA